MLSVRFVNMWSGFNPHYNPLLPILESAMQTSWKVVTSPAKDVDLELGSVYPSRKELAWAIGGAAVRRGVLRSPADAREAFAGPGKSPTAAAGIWYTPENRRPPASGWDASLSYETSRWPRNAYLPYWQLNSTLFGATHDGFLGRPLDVEGLGQPREASTSRRARFCCAILRNPEPVRLRVIEALSRLGSVDVFGPLTGKPVGTKLEVLPEYRFAIVFENDLYPGYITEKPFDAWACGAIPLCWGLDAAGTLNSNAVVNLATLSGLDEFVDRVAELERDPDELNRMAGLPILNKIPTGREVMDLIRLTLTGVD